MSIIFLFYGSFVKWRNSRCSLYHIIVYRICYYFAIGGFCIRRSIDKVCTVMYCNNWMLSYREQVMFLGASWVMANKAYHDENCNFSPTLKLDCTQMLLIGSLYCTCVYRSISIGNRAFCVRINVLHFTAKCNTFVHLVNHLICKEMTF